MTSYYLDTKLFVARFDQIPIHTYTNILLNNIWHKVEVYGQFAI